MSGIRMHSIAGVTKSLNALACVVYVCSFLEANANYYVKDNKEVLDPRHPPCRLATPNIEYSDTIGYTVDLNSTLELNTGDMLWVGYIKRLVTFENKGCMLDNDKLTSTAIVMDSSLDLGECFAKCRGQIFGISTSTCYCFDDQFVDRQNTTKISETSCTMQCQSPRGAPCGGTDDSKTYISIYKKANCLKVSKFFSTKIPVTIDILDLCFFTPCKQNRPRLEGYCRSLDIGSGSYSWENCSEQKKGLCLSRGILKYISKPHTWIDMFNICLAMNMSLLTEDPAGANLNLGTLWINRVQSFVISSYTNLTTEDIEHGEYGYITKVNDVYHLYFTQTLHLDKWLCVSEGNESMTNGSRQNAKGTPELVAVYVSGPLVVTVVVVILILLILRRRSRKFPTEDKRASDIYVSTTTMQTQNETVHNVIYDIEQLPMASYDNCNLNKNTPRYHSSNQTSQLFEPHDNEYDTTICTSPAAIANNNGNVYDHLEDTAHDMYDHTGVTASNTVTTCKEEIHFGHHQHNDTYDHLETQTEDSADNIYDTADDDRKCVQGIRVNDNVYSKTKL